MSTEDADNEQDYAASAQETLENNNSDDDIETPVTTRNRRILSIRIRNNRLRQINDDVGPSSSSVNNTDHNYVTQELPVVSAGSSGRSNITISAMEGDQNNFQEEQDNDDNDTATDDDVIFRRRPAPSTIDSDNTSEDSINTAVTNSSMLSIIGRNSGGSESDNTSEDSISTAATNSSTVLANIARNSGGSLNESVFGSTISSLSSISSQGTSSSESILHGTPGLSINSNESPHVITPDLVSEIEPAAVSNVGAAIQVQPRNNNESIINVDTPSPAKKRKRLSEANQKRGTPKAKTSKCDDMDDDEDDGLTCPICLDNWEMSGEHRLASLKCGHLFGDSCIRRWLLESSRQSGQKVCPQCKTKAHPREIRFLYAKRLRAIDRSEEHRMREQLNTERSKSQNFELELATLKMSYAQATQKLKMLEADNDSLNIMLRSGGGSFGNSSNPSATALRHCVTYKLHMDRNIEISREPGCRVMKYAEHQASIFVSQKSAQGLFPGYGLRFVDTVSFKPTNFLYASLKLLRDISLSADQQLLVAASMETKVKLFDLRTLHVSSIFKPSEKPLWSCALGQRETEHYLYLGSQQGSTYVYDIRFPETIVDEHLTEGDMSPVIQVASVSANGLFPHGGFLVCKLTSLWFYEHTGGNFTNATRLPIEGRFISMDFDDLQQNLVVQTRSCVRHPRARYILGKLNKINNIPVFEIKLTFCGSTNSPVMSRCAQITVESNTLIAAYIQDTKLLTLYDAGRERSIQSLPAHDIIYDMCPIYTKDFTYLASLTENKCRLYKLDTK